MISLTRIALVVYLFTAAEQWLRQQKTNKTCKKTPICALISFKIATGVGEMAQHLRALTVITEDLSWVPSTHISSSQALVTPAPGFLFWPLQAIAHIVYIHMDTHTQG